MRKTVFTPKIPPCSILIVAFIRYHTVVVFENDTVGGDRHSCPGVLVKMNLFLHRAQCKDPSIPPI